MGIRERVVSSLSCLAKNGGNSYIAFLCFCSFVASFHARGGGKSPFEVWYYSYFNGEGGDVLSI